MHMKHFPALIAVLVTADCLPMICSGQVNSGSDGHDGAFYPTTNIVVDMADHPDGIYHYTSVNIPTNVTVSFIPNAHNTPVTWVVQSNCYIQGVVTVAGNYSTGPLGSLGGPGGFSGGNASLGDGVPAGAGLGPGGGQAGLGATPQGGQGSFGTVGDYLTTYYCYGNTYTFTSAPPGAVYGDAMLLPFIGGSGGGGGNLGGGGGGGGGAILIAANGEINVSGRVMADGGDGARVCPGWACLVGGGPGGSGGGIRLVGTTISGTGLLSANGGAGYVGWCDAHIMNYAGVGRIRLDGLNTIFSGQTVGVTTRGYQPIIIPLTNQIARIAIQSVGGVVASASPTGDLRTPDAVISAQQANPVPVVVHCSNLPLNTPITVTVKPANGSSVSAAGENSLGTQASSTATIFLSMPRGGGRIYATVATSN